MPRTEHPGQPLLTFPDADKSPLSIRAKALVFIDARSRQLREEVQQPESQPRRGRIVRLCRRRP